jgi:hypothetical protein
VEHVEVDDRSVHNLYRPLVNSGLAFGAKRWVGTLDRQCERLASAMASNIPNGDLGGKCCHARTPMTHAMHVDFLYPIKQRPIDRGVHP